MSGREFGAAAAAPVAPAAIAAVAAAASPSAAAMSEDAAWRALHRAASERYRAAGRFALHFARGKLGRDPVFRALLERGALAPNVHLLDIGCGQALLASLLAQCNALAAAGQWPVAWGAAPTRIRYTGIDLMPRDIARAECALSDLPQPPRLLCGDMRTQPFERCDVAIALDVLHYVDEAAQLDVLSRLAKALAPRGRLLLRVGDAGRTLRFALGWWIDHAVALARGRRAPPAKGRSLAQWCGLLQELGFRVEAVPMSRGTPFANVLLLCDLERAPR
jgi:SAM-dependent methyltransferase